MLQDGIMYQEIQTKKAKPKAVLISDIHYNISNLPLADKALRQAVDKSNKLEVPLIVAGDLHDTKAHLRGECVSALIQTFELAKQQVLILIGNHDLHNEKSQKNSLEFLAPYENIQIIKAPTKTEGIWFLPYFSDKEQLKKVLITIPAYSIIIAHQGVIGADLGHYVKDSTSLFPEDFKDFRVVSGHYHKQQTIICGPLQMGCVGSFDYIGSPYTQSFAEAKDGDKGFQILNEDGSLTFVSTNLRKHVIVECRHNDDFSKYKFNTDDILWLKVSGPASELNKLDKNKIGNVILGHNNYRFEKISDKEVPLEFQKKKLSNHQELDALIDSLSDTGEHKKYLKNLWRGIV